MNPQTGLEAAAAVLIDAAVRIDNVAGDLEFGRGRVTLVSRILKLGSMATTASAIPVVIAAITAGKLLDQLREIAKVAKAQGSRP